MIQYQLGEQYKSFESISTEDWCEEFLIDWEIFKSKFENDDKIFSYSYHDPYSSWGFCGCGYCIIRNDETVIAEILTLIS